VQQVKAKSTPNQHQQDEEEEEEEEESRHCVAFVVC